MTLFDQAISIAVEHVVYMRKRGLSPSEILRFHNDMHPMISTWDDAVFAVALAWMGCGRKDMAA